ncbi:MAG: transporter substrate-binding domain-containing protein, partial [Eubacteriales bacterium]|nr:transporter substrate-binding domain-containing protein [Eubacteriales bacterium]
AVDAIAVDVGVANYYMSSQTESYQILAEDISSEEYGVGFLKGDTETMYTIQGVLLEMAADGTMDEIAQDYVDMGLVAESLVFPKAFQ